MLPVESDTFVHPLLAMFTQISLYMRNPPSPENGPAVPPPEALDPREVEDPDKVQDLP